MHFLSHVTYRLHLLRALQQLQRTRIVLLENTGICNSLPLRADCETYKAQPGVVVERWSPLREVAYMKRQIPRELSE